MLICRRLLGVAVLLELGCSVFLTGRLFFCFTVLMVLFCVFCSFVVLGLIDLLSRRFHSHLNWQIPTAVWRCADGVNQLKRTCVCFQKTEHLQPQGLARNADKHGTFFVGCKFV